MICRCLICSPKRIFAALLTVSMLSLTACAADPIPDSRDDVDAAESADAAPELSVSKEALVAGFPAALSFHPTVHTAFNWWVIPSVYFTFRGVDGWTRGTYKTTATNFTASLAIGSQSCTYTGATSLLCDGTNVRCAEFDFWQHVPDLYSPPSGGPGQAWNPTGAANWALVATGVTITPSTANLSGYAGNWTLTCNYYVGGYTALLNHL